MSAPEETPQVDSSAAAAAGDAPATHLHLEKVLASIDAETARQNKANQSFMARGIGVEGGASRRDSESEKRERHIIFSIANTAYAAPIENVAEIGRPLKATPVPNVPEWVLGVTNLRGDIISIVDLRAFLGLEATPGLASLTTASRMMVARSRQDDISTALIVDRVSGIGNLPSAQIAPPTAPLEDSVMPYLRGVCEYGGRLLVVMDFEKLLRSIEL